MFMRNASIGGTIEGPCRSDRLNVWMSVPSEIGCELSDESMDCECVPDSVSAGWSG